MNMLQTPQIRKEPTAQSSVLEARRRARNYWWADGVPQLIAGISAVILGLYIGLVFRESPWSLIAIIPLFAFWAITFRKKKITEWLKIRVAYPRTGYIPSPESLAALPDDDMTFGRRLTLWLFAPYLMGLGLLFVVKAPWICLPVAAVVALPFWLARRFGRQVSWIMALGVPITGLYMSLFPVTRKQRVAELFVGIGILLLLDGTVKLIRYLRRNPVLRA